MPRNQTAKKIAQKPSLQERLQQAIQEVGAKEISKRIGCRISANDLTAFLAGNHNLTHGETLTIDQLLRTEFEL